MLNFVPMPTPSAWQRSEISAFWPSLGGGRAQHVQDLAAQRQERLGLAVPRHLGGAARRVALDDEELRPVAGLLRAVGQLAGQAQLLGGGFAAVSFSRLRFRRSSARRTRKSRIGARGLGVGGEPVVEMVAHGGLDQRAASVVASRSLVWP
jgi:hypothetical protein